MIVIICVLVTIALLIATLCGVICAVHLFRREDTSMYVKHSVPHCMCLIYWVCLHSCQPSRNVRDSPGILVPHLCLTGILLCPGIVIVCSHSQSGLGMEIVHAG